jgi:hypothetical protein
VNTAKTTDFTGLPTGWMTPAGGGLHLITPMTVDTLGRTTQRVDPAPASNTTYTVYNDPAHEVATYAGWNATTHLPTGPTQVTREDRPGSYLETFTTSVMPSVDGNGVPTGAEVDPARDFPFRCIGCAVLPCDQILRFRHGLPASPSSL